MSIITSLSPLIPSGIYDRIYDPIQAQAISRQTTKMVSVELPEPFASIPRESLTFGPSPIQPLPRISQALGGKVNIYAKREDCNSGLAFGGNKTRKLE